MPENSSDVKCVFVLTMAIIYQLHSAEGKITVILLMICWYESAKTVSKAPLLLFLPEQRHRESYWAKMFFFI